MKVWVYNQKGEKMEEMDLPKEIFGIEINPDLIHQVAISQMANERQGTAHTKDRGEVKGGGRKPWRQKGTGRARHGSIRSPLWRGGGVTFGPTKEKNYEKKIPKKMRRKAILMLLSSKALKNYLIVLDELKMEKIKTKLLEEILKNFPCQDESRLIILPDYDKNIILSARNLPKVQTIEARNLNVLDLLRYKYLLLPRQSIEVIKKIFLKK